MDERWRWTQWQIIIGISAAVLILIVWEAASQRWVPKNDGREAAARLFRLIQPGMAEADARDLIFRVIETEPHLALAPQVLEDMVVVQATPVGDVVWYVKVIFEDGQVGSANMLPFH